MLSTSFGPAQAVVEQPPRRPNVKTSSTKPSSPQSSSLLPVLTGLRSPQCLLSSHYMLVQLRCDLQIHHLGLFLCLDTAKCCISPCLLPCQFRCDSTAMARTTSLVNAHSNSKPRVEWLLCRFILDKLNLVSSAFRVEWALFQMDLLPRTALYHEYFQHEGAQPSS